ncbi:hypothetical protein EKO27_g8252 [Xylaria grammica]|uniref:Uncharacterized protein n=1 Tax=Xylaria grammica TaxID=363999 RepID=A0A439CXD4_9PEZI|nr:hypothetical protein EKO27_g8252 [Xylaria grammica]
MTIPSQQSSFRPGGFIPPGTSILDAEHLRSLLIERIDEGQEIVLECRATRRWGKKGGIVMILYLASLIISAGQSLQSTIHPSIYPWADGKDGFLIPKGPLHGFYNGVEPSLANKAVMALKPMSSRIKVDKMTYEPWNEGFEVGYIFTEEDNTFVIDTQRAMFSNSPDGSFSASLATGHSPFISAPNVLADAIHDGINYLAKKRTSS